MSPIRHRKRHEASEVTDLVRRLATLLDELRLTEAEVSMGDMRVRVQRAAAPPGSPALPDPVVVVERPSNMVAVEAPMVGTFYRASAPTAEPYVREGDLVKEGEVLCIIEAMKLMNEIEARAGGRIAKILVENGQPVQYEQPIVVLDTTA